MSTSDRTLVSNIQEQLNRVMVQLADLEKEKTSLDAEEYAEMKTDSMDQLKELEQALDRMQGGDITLTDKLTATKLAIRAAISEAFRTPEVVAFFTNKQPALLRQKLFQIETDYRLHKVTKEVYEARKVEILLALFKLGDKLSDNEQHLLNKFSSTSMSNFELASSEISCNESVVNSMLK